MAVFRAQLVVVANSSALMVETNGGMTACLIMLAMLASASSRSGIVALLVGHRKTGMIPRPR